MKALRNIFISMIGFGLISCEKEIFPDLGEPFQLVVIDAWLTNQEAPQSIYITQSQPYFEDGFPQKIDGATVQVISADSVLYDFIENDSAYTWVSEDSSTFGEVGESYFLFVEIDGQQYSSFTTMGRVPAIDSIRFNFEEVIPNFIYEDHYLAEFYATDPAGVGDAYWIKTWKNDQYLNKPSELSFSFDAGASPGAEVDGIQFIQPIRTAINPFDEDAEDERPGFPSPYAVGDSVTVQIHAISPEAYFFLTEVSIQTNRTGGFAALFAQPVANVSTNIFNLDEESQERAVGFFNVGEVSSAGKMLTPEEANEARERFESDL